ncbi:MAG: hypothetical protein JJ934_12325 [Pseudomonadales bacterium]|nr:hypothetical protein [Pseudomonadales bacterium]MBO6564685.1 hypothetical protein [Pseudomonadales bacterium]MBO6596473.1 hypothetical protein [Pseudomonadales bacterium]MBO6657679.1 hypothetical protein [Pseudomonadales bacterium]MBO6822953.1 hypothetical protein [Pseudomonadales bacterium]
MKRLVIILTFLISGCVSAPPEIDPIADAELTQRIAGVAVGHPEAVLLPLSEEVRQALVARVDPNWGDLRKFKHLSAFFFDADEMNIQYHAWSTLDPNNTFYKRQGNCLSMSSLFVAAARYLDFDGYFQTVKVSPSWSHEGNTMIRYEHIVAAGKLGQTEYVVDFLPEFAGTEKQRSRISDEQALALYYSNLAVEAMVTGDNSDGIYKSLQGLQLWQDNANIWNNLGTAYRRIGETELAEASYRRALMHNRNNYSALSNLTQLYLLNGRDEEADRYLTTVSRYYRRNPYYHLQLGDMQITQGKLELARKNLQRAFRLEKDDPLLFDALAEAYNRLNDPTSSSASSKRAEKIRQKERLRKLQSMVNPGQLVL